MFSPRQPWPRPGARPEAVPVVNEHVAANRALWDEWTGVHERSEFYDLEGFKKGGVRIRDYEQKDLGDVSRGLLERHLDALRLTTAGVRVG